MAAFLALGVIASLLAACGGTPEPTVPPPTQTPWIVVVTATPGAGDVAQVQPTQTPWIIIATTTPTAGIKPTTEAPTATGPTQSPTASSATATKAATAQPPTPTSTPDAANLKYPPPALLDPPNGRPVSWKSTVTLEWTSVGKLEADEYYHLHMERRPTTEGEDWYGDYVYTKDTSYVAQGAFLAPFHPPADRDEATVYWWVRVVRKTGESADGKPIGIDIGANSEERTLILEPKPD
ncbi:MAG: hypothetical protein ACK2U2_11575 [Anaerolineae bacterium]